MDRLRKMHTLKPQRGTGSSGTFKKQTNKKKRRSQNTYYITYECVRNLSDESDSHMESVRLDIK